VAGSKLFTERKTVREADQTRGLIADSDAPITGACSILGIDAERCSVGIQINGYRGIRACDVSQDGILQKPSVDVFSGANVHMVTVFPITSGLITQDVEWRGEQSVVARVHCQAEGARWRARRSRPVIGSG